jgi:hypothetical protein
MEAIHSEQLKRLLRQELDWSYLADLAERHGLVPLLYRHLDAAGPTAVPKPVFGRLWSEYQANARRNILLTKELLKLLRLLEANGIPAIPYKGPALAATVYGDISLRHFSDLDILARKRDVPRAKEILEAQGYRFGAGLSDAQERAYLGSRNHHHFYLERDDGKVALELHWDVAPLDFYSAIDVEQLWGRLEPMSLGGARVNSFAAEDLLLLLCMHGSRHLWERLEWVCCVAELIRVKPELDWERAMAQANQLHGSRMLLLGLELAHKLLGTSTPESIRREIKDNSSIQSLASQIRSGFFEEKERPPGVFNRVRCLMRVQDRRVDRIRYGLSVLTAPTTIEWHELPLPASLSFGYRLLRPLRLAGKYGVRLVGQLK